MPEDASEAFWVLRNAMYPMDAMKNVDDIELEGLEQGELIRDSADVCWRIIRTTCAAVVVKGAQWALFGQHERDCAAVWGCSEARGTR